jgi:hypothetical protein
MSVAGLRVEDSNWSPWKARIVLILDELDLWDVVENPVVPPTNVVLLAKFKKRNIKANRTILDAVLVWSLPKP